MSRMARSPRSAVPKDAVAPGRAAPAAHTAPGRRAEILQLLGRRCCELVEPVLQDTLQHYATALADLGDHHAGSIDGVALQRAALRLREDSAAIVTRVLRAIEAQALEDPAKPRPDASLRLVDEDELLDHLAVHRAAAAACRTQNGVPQVFLRRLAALHGRTGWRGERAPFSPAAFAGALNGVLLELAQPREQRDLALTAFARAFGQSALRLYGALDELLAARGVEPLTPDQAPPAIPATETPSGTPRADGAAHALGPLASVDTIGAALAARRRALGIHPAPAHGPLLSDDALDAVLHSLQTAPPAGATESGATDLKSQIAAYFSTHAGTPQPQFEARTDDTIEFVELVFQHLMRQGAAPAPAQSLLRQLEIPIVRVALGDPAFFAEPQHPARRLLNVVSEIALYWLDPQRSDSELHKLARSAVSALSAEPRPSPDLFADTADRLTRAVDRLAQRAQVFESRLVTRAIAQEKLEVARRRAQTFCADLCAALPSDAPQRTFLQSVWKDVLVLTLLRSGLGSERWRERTDAARWVARRSRDPDALTVQQFRRIAEQAITLLGFQSAEIRSLLDDVLAATHAAGAKDVERPSAQATAAAAVSVSNSEAASTSISDAHSHSDSRSSPDSDTGSESTPVAATSAPVTSAAEAALAADVAAEPNAEYAPASEAPAFSVLVHASAPTGALVSTPPGENAGRDSVTAADTANDDVARMRERLRTIPFGCWFEFRLADKTCERQKLAWFSTVTERCLLVAPDGKRAQYRSLEEIARAMVRNEARILDVAPRSWFDRAWRTVTEGLRAFLMPDALDPSRPA